MDLEEAGLGGGSRDHSGLTAPEIKPPHCGRRYSSCCPLTDATRGLLSEQRGLRGHAPEGPEDPRMSSYKIIDNYGNLSV